MSLYEQSVPEFKKTLTAMTGWLDKAAAHAKAKNFDPNVLVGMRLAPDMYSLDRQIQAACDTAKFASARLTAKDPPKHPDTEKTFDELRARIASVLAYLDTFKPADFEGADKRKVALPF